MEPVFLIVHICGAVVALLSGYLAMVMRKGSGLHQVAGSVFFVSMVFMTVSAAFIATFMRTNRMNVVAAMFTFYLVVTAWWVARHREAKIRLFDGAALLFVFVVALGGLTFGFEAAGNPNNRLDKMPAPIYFIFGSVALLHGISDVRMFIRGGVSGGRRIVRHLWRMCLALLITTLSFYPGQGRLFSKAIRETNLLFVPHILLVGAILFWLVRMRGRKRAEKAVALKQEQTVVGEFGRHVTV